MTARGHSYQAKGFCVTQRDRRPQRLGWGESGRGNWRGVKVGGRSDLGSREAALSLNREGLAFPPPHSLQAAGSPLPCAPLLLAPAKSHQSYILSPCYRAGSISTHGGAGSRQKAV